MEEMREELREVVRLTSSGELFAHPPFDSVPSPLRRLNDIALSGDAEPTTVKEFSRIIETAIAVLDEFNLRGMKIVLITDAGGLDRPDVKRGLRLMDAHGGEVWAKLDAGTEEYFKAVNRTKIPFARILRNITESAKARPIVIQSLFMRLHDALPSDAEIQAYWERLNDITRAGGTIKLVQVYTVARRPAEPFVSALTDEEVDRIAAVVLQRTSLPVEKYYGG
jgi:wyosine [tRNA(Phe)-imidazoG37] synthetase (radical SAM superfamily)